MCKILLPVDGSETSLDKVRHALWLVHSGPSARLVRANVQTPATLYETASAHDPGVIDQTSAPAEPVAGGHGGQLHANPDGVILEPVDAQHRQVAPRVAPATTPLTNLASHLQLLIRLRHWRSRRRRAGTLRLRFRAAPQRQQPAGRKDDSTQADPPQHHRHTHDRGTP